MAQSLLKQLKHMEQQAEDTEDHDTYINDYDHFNRPMNTVYIINQELKTIAEKLAEKSENRDVVKQLRPVIEVSDGIEDTPDNAENDDVPMDTLETVRKLVHQLINTLKIL